MVNLLFEITNKNENLRNALIFKKKINFTVHIESESLSSLAPKICGLVSDSIKEKKYEFSKIKQVRTNKKCPF